MKVLARVFTVACLVAAVQTAIPDRLLGYRGLTVFFLVMALEWSHLEREK